MGIPQSQLAPWTRKHDKPGTPLIAQAPVTLFPQSLQDLIAICQSRPPGQRLHAAGSHWALSTSAISDHSFIETHDFHEIFPAMGRTLFNVVPACLAEEFLIELNNLTKSPTAAQTTTPYFYHFESGKRIFQLYAEMDVGDSNEPESLAVLMKTQFNNTAFEGSWGFHTLGGAGGQTVVGALSTGTHGGDFDRAPIADSVIALHIVTDGGKHLWIERSHSHGTPFTDEAKLRALFGDPDTFGGPNKVKNNFDVIYDDNVLRAALVQVGRFGIIYSAVISVEPQYGLRTETVLDTWENVRGKIIDPTSDLFTKAFVPAPGVSIPQRFLTLAVNPIPKTNGTQHTCSITRHWPISLAAVPPSALPPVNWSPTINPAGRAERVGDLVLALDPVLNAPFFARAGLGVAFSPNDAGITSFDLFDSACADANFMDGIVSGIITEIENFLSSHAVAIGGGLAAAIATGIGPGILALAPWLLLLLPFLLAFLNSLRNDGGTAGQAFNNLRNALLSSSDPNQRAAGILIWRAIAEKVWEAQQGPQLFTAISYAVLDGHNYADISCTVNVRSVEVFFDATDPNLLAFVERLLQFEIDQEFQSGLSVAGYISLRFCKPSGAWIAPEAFPRTVSVECSGLADEAGSIQFVDFAEKLAQDPNIKGVLHWGQQNHSTQPDIEFRFGDGPNAPTGPLHEWRAALATLTDNGRLDGFSSDFTRQTGLEIVQPMIGAFFVKSAPTHAAPSCTVVWDCINNPPEATVTLDIQSPSMVVTTIGGQPLAGSHTFTAAGPGTYLLTLHANLDRNGVTRSAAKSLSVPGV